MSFHETVPAFRTKPCRYFARSGVCVKGADCTFTHIDEEGNDLHQSFSLNSLDGEEWQDGAEDPAGLVDGIEEVDLNEVGGKAELSDEEEDSFRLAPHFGTYSGIGS